MPSLFWFAGCSLNISMMQLENRIVSRPDDATHVTVIATDNAANTVVKTIMDARNISVAC